MPARWLVHEAFGMGKKELGWPVQYVKLSRQNKATGSLARDDAGVDREMPRAALFEGIGFGIAARAARQ